MTQLSTGPNFDKVFGDTFPEPLFEKSLLLMETVETYL
jgi:hypothetical protein